MYHRYIKIGMRFAAQGCNHVQQVQQYLLQYQATGAELLHSYSTQYQVPAACYTVWGCTRTFYDSRSGLTISYEPPCHAVQCDGD